MPTRQSDADQQGKKTIAVPMKLWAGKRGEHIRIRLVAPGQPPVTVSNDPQSVRFHRTLFRNLRKTLIANGAWPYGDEGSQIRDLKLKQEAEYFERAESRYRPIRAKGGASASEIVLRDRERF
jgi:hypothetical protein